MKLKNPAAFAPLALATCVGFSAFAAEIAFDGGETGQATDLAVAANWAGDVLPTASDVATVNCATWTNLTLGGNLSVSALKLSGATTAVTLDGSGTLTLGSGGLAFDAKQTFNLKVPVVTAAEQTWTFALGTVNAWATISGTAKLTWTAAGIVNFRAAPQYDGAFSCIAWGVRHFTTGKVAASFYASTSSGAADNKVQCHNAFLFPGETSLSDLFTDGSYTFRGWRRLFLSVPKAGATASPTLRIDRDTDLLDGQGPYRTGVANGIVDHSAGTIKTGRYGITVGASEDLSAADIANTQTKTWPCLWKMSGSAVYTGAYVFIGERASDTLTNYPCFIQSGGTSTVGKCVAIGAAVNASGNSFAEYKMTGGTLEVGFGAGDDHQSKGLAICHSFGGATSQPGAYTQTGGDVTVSAVKFGPDSGAWGGSPNAVNASLGLFSLLGGSLTLAKDGAGIGFGKGWNTTATSSSRYRFNHGGGTLVSKLDHTVRANVNFPQGDTPSTWNTEANGVVIDAPIAGDGTLRKTGSGRLTLTDASRFTGTLRIDEGEVFLPGAPFVAAPSTNENCWVWTADSLTASFAHGQSVSNWVDRNHGLAASDWMTANTLSYQNRTRYLAEKKFDGKAPTLDTKINMNGHAALWFDRAYLGISPTDNPLVDGTNFTIAVVYRPNYFEGNEMVWYGGTILGGGDWDYTCDVPILNTWSKDGRAMFGGVFKPDGKTRKERKLFSRSGRSLALGTHVAVMTVRGLEFTLVTDGGVTATNFAETVTSRKMFRTSGQRAMAFNLGGHFADELNFSYCPSYIAEVRIYRDRSLTVEQQQAIAAELLKTYRSDGDGIYLGERNGTYSGSFAGEDAQDDPAPCPCEWTAETVSGVADGGEVTTWANTSNTVDATAAVGAGERGPALDARAFNGHGALRFSSEAKTALGVAAGKAPIYTSVLSFAAVFRTRQDVPPSAVNYNRNTGVGVFSTDLAKGNARVGLKMMHQGFMMPMSGWAWYEYPNPLRLNDGMPHVVVFTRAAGGDWAMNVDGVPRAGTQKNESAVPSSIPLLIGCLATAQDTGYFTGDIADLRLYDRQLTTAESAALVDYLAWKYGFEPLAKNAFASRDLAKNGLGATNIVVAAGARLALPTPEDGASITFGAGETIDLVGEFGGALELKDGATLRMDPSAGKTRIDRLVASGTITLDVKAVPSVIRRGWIPLADVGASDIAGARWVLNVGNPNTAVCVRDGVLGIALNRGGHVIVR